MTVLPTVRGQLLHAAQERADRRLVRMSRRPSSLVHLRAVAIVVVALLAIAAVALAAAGVFSPGRPVEPVSVPTPRAFDGAAIPSTIRVLAVRASDPTGGPEWGLRLVDTTRGEICVTPGRVEAAIIGVLGRDHAFGDDGRLHPFAADYIDHLGCAVPDAGGHAFISIGQTGLAASALSQGIAAEGGCRVDNPPPADRTLLCPSTDLRDVYYGLLGPDAMSVTFRASSGGLVTERTAGADGAYLIVLPYAHGERQGTATIGTGPAGAPIVSVRYRDGHVCATAGVHACPPVGYSAPPAAHLTAAKVRAPITARVIAARSYCNSTKNSTVVPCGGRVPRGFSRIVGAPFVLIEVSFTARLPVANSHSRYQMDLSYARSPGCTVGGVDGPTNADIHVGQRIHMQDFHPVSCPGPVHGVISYVQGSALASVGLPGSPRASSVIVGRFAVNPTASRRASR